LPPSRLLSAVSRNVFNVTADAKAVGQHALGTSLVPKALCYFS
jgi:hypothetical protein